MDLTVSAEEAGGRLDAVLAAHVGSRSRAQRLLELGAVLVDGAAVPKRHKVSAGERISVDLDADRRAPEPDAAPADFRVAYEDDRLLVVDKPAGVVVHPARGHSTGTLVQALSGRAAGGGDAERPGIVHRLDRDTSGLLVVAIALALLQVRTPSMPLARAACVGILGLGIAGACSALCPDQHFLDWWVSTFMGSSLGSMGGLPLSALCFGGVTTLVFGTVAAIMGLGGRHRGPIRPLLPAAMLLLLLTPGVALQSFGTPALVFVAWLLGTGAGAYAGVALGLAARKRLALS